MNRYISEELRQEVIRRANFICEYCLIHENEAYIGCEVDHILSLKHGGTTELSNLAYSCFRCNRHKGSDIGSFNPLTGQFVRFFNPRLDHWPEHFQLRGPEIVALTEIGEVTVRILGLNSPKRLEERTSLFNAGIYPSSEAMEIIGK